MKHKDEFSSPVVLNVTGLNEMVYLNIFDKHEGVLLLDRFF